MLKTLIRKNEKLYVALQGIRMARSEEYRDVFLAYIQNDKPLLWMKSYGDKNENALLLCPKIYNAGFFALLRRSLECVDLAQQMKLTPVIVWNSDCAYAEKQEYLGTHNPFEYYFEPVCGIGMEEALESKNVFISNNAFRRVLPYSESYEVDREQAAHLSELYRKYFRLNTTTRKIIERETDKMIRNRKMLGVHVRGGDYNKMYKNHPLPISIEHYIERVSREFALGGYECIFLATDDNRALEVFREKFADKLVYFDDVIRCDDDSAVESISVSRSNHHYKLGLAVLRDAYTLARCRGIVCSKSKVAQGAIIINRAEYGEFENIVILDQGIA